MTTAAIYTVVLFPIYLLLREPFRRLPLHIDTGFYVSNHTIASGRFSFSKGWNAHYAGCSKVLPEVFYSLIYLLHGRGRANKAGGDSYKRLSRLCASVFNYGSAVIVGILSCALSQGDLQYYCAGLTVFSLLSSEPQYGVYFECGELFELVPNVVTVVCVVFGLQQGAMIWIGAGAFVWAAGACFIKLSAAIGFVVLFGGLVIAFPWAWLPVSCGGAAAGALFAAWMAWNGQSPLRLAHALRGHEASFNPRSDWRGFVYRMREKVRTVAYAMARQPWIPAFAVLGVVLGPPHNTVFWLYAAAVLVAYVGQATDCRYYLIPLLPPIAVCAVNGAMVVWSTGLVGIVAVGGIGAAWVLGNSVRAARMDIQRLNAWCWKGAMRSSQAARNQCIEELAEVIRPVTLGQSLLVYGPLNQAYVLLHCSYDTPIVAPESYLNDVCPGWQREHNRRLVADSPKWILDTSCSFDAAEARGRLGLDYRMTHLYDDDLRLYRLVSASSPSVDYEAACTYRQQSRAELEAEEQLAGSQLVVRREAGWYQNAATGSTASALSALIQDLADRGHRRLAIYGAGRFTIRHAEIYRRSLVPVSVVLDDNAALRGPTFLDWPVRSPEEATVNDFDAIIISTDRFMGPMLANIRRRWGDEMPAYTIST